MQCNFIIFQVHILVITYGILFGGGSSLVYTPSLVILGHYFRRHIGLVNGLVATGSSIFTIVMPHILKILLEDFGVRFFILAYRVSIRSTGMSNAKIIV